MNAEELLTRSLKLLQGSIRASSLTQTEIDEKIGRRRGYLSHVFQRRVDLKLVDLLSALAVLGIPPGVFFAAVTDSTGGGLIDLLRETDAAPIASPAAGDRLRFGTSTTGPVHVGRAESSLEQRVRQVLRRIIRDLATEAEHLRDRG